MASYCQFNQLLMFKHKLHEVNVNEVFINNCQHSCEKMKYLQSVVHLIFICQHDMFELWEKLKIDVYMYISRVEILSPCIYLNCPFCV